MVSPADTLLIDGGSEERRRLMDMVISQYDRPYMEYVSRYNKALLQRNAMLKQEEEQMLNSVIFQGEVIIIVWVYMVLIMALIV